MTSHRLQILTNVKVKENSGWFYNVKLKKQTIHISHDSSNEYRKKFRTTFTKQAKEILDISNPNSVALAIKEKIKLLIEICFER